MRLPVLKFAPIKNPFLNKPLEEEYKKNRLSQKERSPCEPWHQGDLIKMNSAFLECTDGIYRQKGFLTILLPLLHQFCGGLFGGLNHLVTEGVEHFLDVLEPIMLAVFLLFFLYFLSYEYFRYTHYPIRFNRKTRKVYKYNWNGTAMVEDWDKLHFALGTPTFLGERAVIAFRFAEDGETVVDSFPLPFYTDKNDSELLSQWEFVRRYMEVPKELPQLAAQVESVADIADRRETYHAGVWRLILTYTGSQPLLMLLLLPLWLFNSIGRWLAMRTCTVPVWPEEVERECQIEPNDPYLRDRDHLAPLHNLLGGHLDENR